MTNCVFVTGCSRSGTSMTAGLLAAHGIWFGPCHGPRSINKKGFFESNFVKRCIKTKNTKHFQKRWRDWMSDNVASEPWGVKTGPELFHLFRPFKPLVIHTYRPEQDIIASRKRAAFNFSKNAVDIANRAVDAINANKIQVFPDQFVKGDYSSIIPAFELLDVEFNKEIASDWIEPGLWNHG